MPLAPQDMAKVCHRCPLWVKVIGKHPQQDATIDHWNCSLAWLPILTIENSQMQRQTGAAVESFRNEMVRLNAAHLELELSDRHGMGTAQRQLTTYEATARLKQKIAPRSDEQNGP